MTAIVAIGTNANNSITNGLKFLPGYNSGMAAADIATINNAIKNDADRAGTFGIGGQFTAAGQLFIPRRGILQVLPGDWVGVDPRGWPILLSADTVANGPWNT